MAIELDLTVFRGRFREFSNETDFPDAVIESVFEDSKCYIDENDICGFLNTACRTRALYLMTAHILKIENEIDNGGTSNFITSAKVGDVSVTSQPPKETDSFGWWLSFTEYGKQLHALLKVNSAGGIYVGGRREIGSFRRSGGGF